MIHGTVRFHQEHCKGCELCIVACPQECLGLSSELNKQGYRFAQLTSDTCTGCVNCALVCPDSVITVLRQKRETYKASRAA